MSMLKPSDIEVPVHIVEKYEQQWAKTNGVEYVQLNEAMPTIGRGQARQPISTSDEWRHRTGASGRQMQATPGRGPRPYERESEPELPKGMSVSDHSPEPARKAGYSRPHSGDDIKQNLATARMPGTVEELFQQLATGSITTELEHQLTRALVHSGISGTLEDALEGARQVQGNPDGMERLERGPQRDALYALHKWWHHVAAPAGDPVGYKGAKTPLRSKLGLGGPSAVPK